MALSTQRSFEEIFAAILGAARAGSDALARATGLRASVSTGLALSVLLLAPCEWLTRWLYRLPRHKGRDIPFASPPILLMGSMGDFFLDTDEFARRCERAIEGNPGGDGMVLLQFPFNFLPPIVAVSSQEHVKEVLGPKVTMASDRSLFGRVLFAGISQALFTVSASNGDWKRQHRVCMRGFGSPHKLQEYSTLINGRVAQFVSVLEGMCAGKDPEHVGWSTHEMNIKSAGPGAASCLLGPLFETLTLRVVSDLTVCGSTTQEELLQFQEDLEVWLKMSVMATLMIPGLKYLPLPANRRFHAAQARMMDLIHTIIKRCRASGMQGNSLVAELLKASSGEQKHGALTDVEVQHNVFGFIMAGNLTTADLLHSATFMLARHPEVQEQLFAEVRHLSVGDVFHASTPVLDAVLHETLRLYPPAPMTPERTLSQKVCDISYGTRVLVTVNTVVLQRNKAWGQDANEWRPSRWTDGSISQETRDNYFTVFGAGVRHCIGKHVALLEARTALAGLVKTIEVSELEPEKFAMTLVPRSTVKRGLGLVVRRR